MVIGVPIEKMGEYGYAVFVAGAGLPRFMGIPGESLKGIPPTSSWREPTCPPARPPSGPVVGGGTSPNPLIRSTTPGLETNKHGMADRRPPRKASSSRPWQDQAITCIEGVGEPDALPAAAVGDAVTGAATGHQGHGCRRRPAAKAMDEYIQNK